MAVWLLTQGVIILGFVFAIVKSIYAREEDRLVARQALAIQNLLSAHDSDENSHRPLVRRWQADRDGQLNQLIELTAETITAKVEKSLTTILSAHNADPHAHGPASDHNHAPIVNEIREAKVALEAMAKEFSHVRRSVDNLVVEHNIITKRTGSHPCALKGEDDAL